MTQRHRAQRWLAGAAVAAAALSPSSATASAASSAASSPAGRVTAVRPAAPAGSVTARGRGAPGTTLRTAPKTDDTDADPVADVPHEAYEELAGSAAGVGRERPGRPAAEPANPETVLANRPLPARPQHRPAHPADPRQVPRVPQVAPVPQVPPVPHVPHVPPVPQALPSPPPVVTAIGTGPNERAADLAAHILPLGTGFALMGLGLGYLGMRLRKGL
ncbi:hypothetical protein [Streptomyces sp. NBC_00211]|uniref:hypothetical protein n=1 Tax=Streptomyces sp. NBC_00211 TaxID=2975683 RepID=UPI00324CF774